MDHRFTRSNDGESSESSKRQRVDSNASSHDRLERVRRDNFLYINPSPESRPAPLRSQELHESNVDEEVVEFIDNPLFDKDRLLPPAPLNNKVDQTQVAPIDHGSSAGLAEGSDSTIPPRSSKRKRGANIAPNGLASEPTPRFTETVQSLNQDIFEALGAGGVTPMLSSTARDDGTQEHTNPDVGLTSGPSVRDTSVIWDFASGTSHQGRSDQAGPSDHAEAASTQEGTWTTRQLHQQPESTSWEMPVAQQTGDSLAESLEKRKSAEFLIKHEHNAYLSCSYKSQMNYRNQKKVEYNDKEVLAMRLYKAIYHMLNGHKSTDDIKRELDCRRQTEEYRKIFKDDLAGPSEQAKSEQERPWTNQQLSNFVIEVHTMFENEPNIKNSELRNKLKADDSKKIFYELHYNKKSFTDDDWNNVIYHALNKIGAIHYNHKTYNYFHNRTKKARECFNAYHANRRRRQQPRPNDAPGPSR
jgi:hypothetical protein